MKKFITRGLAVLLSTVTLLTLFGCSDDTGSSSGSSGSGGSSGTSSTYDDGENLVEGTSTATIYNTSTRPFTMSISAIDGNFNPFFYTAQNDGNVASLTQASMLTTTTDSAGNAVIAYGENYPTIVKDYTMTSYSSSGAVINSANATSSSTDHTTYSFLIKNGMKFSDGEDLTIMDVLFSLYVNIDMAYTGSATLYSNDIQGLNKYRQQDENVADGEDTSTNSFTTMGQQRINDIVAYCDDNTTQATNQILADIETVKKLFLEELTSDWTTVEESFGSRDEDTYEYNFTETWQAYYLNESVIKVQRDPTKNNAKIYNEDGTYQTDLDINTLFAEEIEEVKKDANAIAAYTSQGIDYDIAVDYVVRDYCINYVWESMVGGYGESYNRSYRLGIAEVVQYWATASTALETFAGDERTKYYEELKKNNNGLVVETISGVTTERVTSFNGVDLGDTYDVLNITINGVDPKAIWNFAFVVCPLHYYSGTWNGKDYVSAAQKDYEAYVKAWDSGDKTYQLTEFGVECGNSDFFNTILQDTDKNGKPVGAGPYAASDSSGGDGTKTTFYSNKMVYYKRNEYFYTMGKGIHNAIIKYVRYKEMSDNSVVDALTGDQIDYGTPSATVTNQSELTADDDLDATTLYDTNGYGYVGINPKYVPDVKVRQAIMKAINTSLPITYYSSDYASTIYRPMSKTSWAYPENCTEYSKIAYTTDVDEIKALVEDAGYELNSSNIYTNGTTTCEFTFTIAGDTTDHPAYQMFTQAAKLLNQCGFDITVKTDSNALSKLATGNLAVWAAAWSSAIDPDMYQVYHKDSTASSVKNWNYPDILANSNEWPYEYNIIVNKLSPVIEKARETNNQTTRATYYAEALDYVMDLAVELPTYQRKDNEVFNKKFINRSSLTENPSTYASLIDRIWEIDYN